MKTLRKSDEKCKDELKACEDVVAGVKAKIFKLFSDLFENEKVGRGD